MKRRHVVMFQDAIFLIILGFMLLKCRSAVLTDPVLGLITLSMFLKVMGVLLLYGILSRLSGLWIDNENKQSRRRRGRRKKKWD